MKYYTICNEKLVLFTFFLPCFCDFLPFLMFLFAPEEHRLNNGLYVLALFVLLWGICALIHHDACALVKMDETGLKKKHTELKWEEITRVEIEEIKLLRFSLLPTIPVSSIVFSSNADGNRNKIIKLSLNPKNVKHLVLLGKNKSTAISNFLENKI